MTLTCIFAVLKLVKEKKKIILQSQVSKSILDEWSPSNKWNPQRNIGDLNAVVNKSINNRQTLKTSPPNSHQYNCLEKMLTLGNFSNRYHPFTALHLWPECIQLICT